MQLDLDTLEPVPDAMVAFGAGYGVEVLGRADWLSRCALNYWGDIDTHGLAILDQLRAHHPHAVSLLMDRETLLAHRPQWTARPQPVLRDLPLLTPAERALHDELRWRRLDDGPLRLEPERIGFGWVRQTLATVLGST